MALAAVAAALITGAGNVYNDLRDLEVDRINRPHRPLPAGGITTQVAAVEAALLALVGWLLSWWLGPGPWAIASGVILGLFLYNSRLKSTVLWGNLAVSSMAAAAFPYGALAAGAVGRAWIPAIFAFLFHCAREIIKDMEDVIGDRRRGMVTLALRLGPQRASVVATSVFALLMAVTPVPWALRLYGGGYAIAIGLLDVLLLVVLVKMRRERGHLADQRLSRTLTCGMVLGLLAIVLGEAL